MSAAGYEEHPAPLALGPLVSCLWEQNPAERHEQLVIPDGCVDLIWLGEERLTFAGADTLPRRVSLPGGLRSSGLRLRPGAAGAVLGLPAAEVCDMEVSAEEVWGPAGASLQQRLQTLSPGTRLTFLAYVVAARRAQPDRLVLAAAERLSTPRASVASAAACLGVSERTLHRRTRAAVGYGPKLLARVARLRRLISLDERDLSGRAYEAGYASQAHMNDEVRSLTGLTPVRFLEDAARRPA